MAFWTITDGDGDLTFCGSCALESTNAAFVICGIEPYKSMEDAAVIFSMIAAIGSPDMSLSSRPTGTCANCHAKIEVA